MFVVNILLLFFSTLLKVVYCIVVMTIWPSFWIGIGGLSVQALF